MQKVIKTKVKVSKIKDLSKTSRELKVSLEEEMEFLAGSFVNFFTEIDGKKVRRAYSISSSSFDKNNFTISVRRVSGGLMSDVFWNNDIVGKEFEIVGPLGLNTVDKMKSEKVFLFAFGIGVSVIKGVLHSILKNIKVKEIFIITGNVNEKEILYKEFFDSVAVNSNKKIKVKYVLSDPEDKRYPVQGFIQNNISGYNFSDSDIYICGRESHCNVLVKEIKKNEPDNVNFLIEGFH